MHTMEMPLERALRRSNNRGSIKFSAGYFKKVDITEGSPKAPAGTTVKMTVAEKGAPVRADPPRDTERRGKCQLQVHLIRLKESVHSDACARN